jgi:hypothetical protein
VLGLGSNEGARVKLGGLNAKGITNREEARERAEQLRPVFTEILRACLKERWQQS